MLLIGKWLNLEIPFLRCYFTDLLLAYFFITSCSKG